MPFDDTGAASEAAAAVEAEAGPGATAILHGMLATLAEVLGELDKRLVSIEAAVHERDPGPAETATAVVDGVHHRLDRLSAAVEGLHHALHEAGTHDDDGEREAAFHALDAVAARLEARFDRLEARTPTAEALAAPIARLEASLREVHGAVAEGMLDLAARQARLVDEIHEVLANAAASAASAASGPPEASESGVDRDVLRGELERLEVALRGQVAEITGQARSVADVLGGLDGRVRDLVEGVRSVSQHAGALAALPKRLEALRDDVAALVAQERAVGPGGPPGGVARHSA